MKTIKNVVEIGGWLGMVLILGAYAANIFEIINVENFGYLTANAVGASLVGWNAFVKKAYPPFVLQIAWFAIAIFGIFKFLA